MPWSGWARTCVIGGSLASTIRSVVCTTLDTGIVADLTWQQAQPFADLLAGAFYLDIDTLILRKNHGVEFCSTRHIK